MMHNFKNLTCPKEEKDFEFYKLKIELLKSSEFKRGFQIQRHFSIFFYH